MQVVLSLSGRFKDATVAGVPCLSRMQAAVAVLNPEHTVSFVDGVPSPPLRASVETFWLEGVFPLLDGPTLLDLLARLRKTESAVGRFGDGFEAGFVYLRSGLDDPSRANYARLSGFPGAAQVDPPREWIAVGSFEQLAEANETAFRRNALRLSGKGARILSLSHVWIEDGVEVAQDAVIEPNVYLAGKTKIATGARIHMGCVLKDATVGASAVIRPYSVVEESTVGAQASVGPFAHIRPGTVLGERVRVGNFVETKKVTMGADSKASHLTYLGDADIGEDCNIGAGTITCNYDGFRKHRTTLGNRVFIGSDSQLVAPVTLGEGSFVAAGSTITRDVPQNGLAIARSRQVNKEGKAEVIRKKFRKE